jgi:short-subunit dehydrogenase
MRPLVIDGGTAVVTGAAGGIGRAVARELSARGARLVLLDRDAEGLGTLSAELQSQRPDLAVDTYVIDLSDRDATVTTAHAVRDANPRISLLVNNAGVALGGRFAELSLDDIDWLLSVNLDAVLVITHELLPCLLAVPGSHVVNMSSLFGLIAPGGQTAYATSKFAVRGFSDALRAELAEHEVGVTAVHPGGIRTSIAESARIGAGVDTSSDEYAAHRQAWRALLTIEPDVAARLIVDGAVRRRPRVLIGASTHVLDALARLAPGSYGRLVAAGNERLMRRIARTGPG